MKNSRINQFITFFSSGTVSQWNPGGPGTCSARQGWPQAHIDPTCNYLLLSAGIKVVWHRAKVGAIIFKLLLWLHKEILVSSLPGVKQMWLVRPYYMFYLSSDGGREWDSASIIACYDGLSVATAVTLLLAQLHFISGVSIGKTESSGLGTICSFRNPPWSLVTGWQEPRDNNSTLLLEAAWEIPKTFWGPWFG